MYGRLLLNIISVKPYVRMKGNLDKHALRIRTLATDDWESVRSIYLAGMATGQATFETEAPTWERWDGAHLPAPRFVAIANEGIVGWAALSAVSARSVYAGVAEVSVYVASEWHGQGVGRALLEILVNESEGNGIWTLQASIFPENVASISLHKSCGFREVGTRERIGKMNGVWRDTVLLERRSKLVGCD
jgi:L-amino acid N-acyltransferase YncA